MLGEHHINFWKSVPLEKYRYNPGYRYVQV